MFIRTSWYAAAWSHEVGSETILARRFLDEPVVIYRRADGAPVALEDRCCHRGLPLALGRIVGDRLQCGYHGLVFDPTGACVRVPGQTLVPPEARIKSYPVIERHKMIWIWMGEPARADAAEIPDFHWLDSPRYQYKPDYFKPGASWRLVLDNLLDLSHVAFLHGRTIGIVQNADFSAKSERSDNGVVVTRWMLDVPPSPSWSRLGLFAKNVDRCQIVNWTPPGFVWIDIGGAVAGTGAPEGDRSQGIELFNVSIVTPATARATHYFWAQVLGFGLDNPALSEQFHTEIKRTFDEDQMVLEAQQRVHDASPNPPQIDIHADAGVLQMRAVLDRLIAAERAVGDDA